MVCYGSDEASISTNRVRLPVCSGYMLLFSIIMVMLNYDITIATSTDVERAFLRGGLTVSKMQHSLSDESTRAATVLSSWCNFPIAIPRDEIISVFRDKSRRPKGGKGKEVSSNVVPSAQSSDSE